MMAAGASLELDPAADASPLDFGTEAPVRTVPTRAVFSSTADLGGRRRPGSRWWRREGRATRRRPRPWWWRRGPVLGERMRPGEGVRGEWIE
jgi:hypothetical protein